MKRGILFWVYWKANGNWDNSMIRIWESHYRKNTSVKKKKKNPKEQDCENHSQGKETFRAGKLTIWAMLFEIEEKLKQGSPELSVPPE